MSSSHELSPAVEVFSQFLARIDDGEVVDFEAFCAEHVELQDDLRRMHEKWSGMASAFSELSWSSRSAVEFPEGSREAELLSKLSSGDRQGKRYESPTEIGRGGMGSVYRVFDPELRRSIAMKVLADEGADARHVSRFLEEAQVTGQLEHPGIVPIHEIGLDPDGRLYYTMPLIRGRDFKEIIDLVHAADDAEWSLHRALGVLVRVAEAMAYAHDKGVLHRDLKPANIMVASFGETYVVDWGLARVLANESRVSEGESLTTSRRQSSSGAETSSLLTCFGDIVGTPAYMPPEQARGEAIQAGAHSDIYSMGAVLYHLLTGRVPYAGVGDQPSSKSILNRVREAPPVSVRSIKPDLPGELVAICERAMAREPSERFASMMDLADNLRAFLEGRVVHAYETGALAELRKWVARNRLLSAASATALIALVVGFLVSTRLFFEADANAKRADANAETLATELSASVVQRGRLLAASENFEAGAAMIWREHLWGKDRRQTLWALREIYAKHPVLVTHDGHGGEAVKEIRALPDGSFLSAGYDGRLKRWRPPLFDEPELVADLGVRIEGLDVSTDGSRAVTGGADGRVIVWDLATRKSLQTWTSHSMDEGQVGPPLAKVVLFDDKDHFVWSAGVDGRICRHDSLTGARSVVRREADWQIMSLALHPDGDRYAFGRISGEIRVASLGEKGSIVKDLPGHKTTTRSLLFSQDGQLLFSGSSDRTVREWKLETGEHRSITTFSETNRELILLDGDSKLLVCGRWSIDFWDLESGERIWSRKTIEQGWGMAISPDGTVLATGHERGKIRFWDLAADRSLHRIDIASGNLATAVSPDGTLAAISGVGWLRLHDVVTGKCVRTLVKARRRALAFSPDSRLLAAGRMGRLEVFRLRDGKLLLEDDRLHNQTRGSVAFDPSGRFLAMATVPAAVEVDGVSQMRGRVAVLDVESGRTVAEWHGPSFEALSLAFDRSGEHIAIAHRRGLVAIRRRTGELVRVLSGAGSRWAVRFHPDGKSLLVAGWEGTIQQFDLESGEEVGRFTGHDRLVVDLLIAKKMPGVMFSATSYGEIRAWDLATRRNLLVIREGVTKLEGFGLSDDGRTLAAGIDGNQAAIYDLTYFDRHLLGNMDYPQALLQKELGDPLELAELEAWRAAVRAREWPRFQKAN